LEALQVRMAYDLRGTNPIRAWHPADFEIEKAPILVEREGDCKIASIAGNRLVVVFRGRDFKVTITGFDTKRDLFVRAEAVDAVETYDHS